MTAKRSNVGLANLVGMVLVSAVAATAPGRSQVGSPAEGVGTPSPGTTVVPGLLAGHYAQIGQNMAACPKRRDLDRLTADVVANDEVGFGQHMVEAGCVELFGGWVVRVIGSSGFLSDYAHIRELTHQKAYWINADPGFLLQWEPVTIGQDVVTTQDAVGPVAACPAGLWRLPPGQAARWMKANCVDVLKGTHLRVTGVRPLGGVSVTPLIGFTYRGKQLWLEWPLLQAGK